MLDLNCTLRRVYVIGEMQPWYYHVLTRHKVVSESRVIWNCCLLNKCVSTTGKRYRLFTLNETALQKSTSSYFVHYQTTWFSICVCLKECHLESCLINFCSESKPDSAPLLHYLANLSFCVLLELVESLRTYIYM